MGKFPAESGLAVSSVSIPTYLPLARKENPGRRRRRRIEIKPCIGPSRLCCLLHAQACYATQGLAIWQHGVEVCTLRYGRRGAHVGARSRLQSDPARFLLAGICPEPRHMLGLGLPYGGRALVRSRCRAFFSVRSVAFVSVCTTSCARGGWARRGAGRERFLDVGLWDGCS